MWLDFITQTGHLPGRRPGGHVSAALATLHASPWGTHTAPNCSCNRLLNMHHFFSFNLGQHLPAGEAYGVVHETEQRSA